MLGRRRSANDSSLRCSFCQKAQGVVAKLISSPSDYPRAYICDECISVCNCIIEDERLEDDPLRRVPHPVFSVPVYTSHFSAVLKFTREEAEQLRQHLDQALASAGDEPDPPGGWTFSKPSE